jgi:hypothetical protein
MSTAALVYEARLELAFVLVVTSSIASNNIVSDSVDDSSTFDTLIEYISKKELEADRQSDLRLES